MGYLDTEKPSTTSIPSISGNLPQAKARNEAPRGGTPNAPSQPNGTTPNGAPGSDGQPSAIAAPQTSPGLVEQALRTGQATRNLLSIASPTNIVGKGLEMLTAPFADKLKGAVYGAAGVDVANPTQYTDQAGQSMDRMAGIAKSAVAPVMSAIASQPDAVKRPVPTPATPQPAVAQTPAVAAPVAAPAAPAPQDDQLVSVPVPPRQAAAPVQPVVDPIAIANNAARTKLDAITARENANFQGTTNAMIGQVNQARAMEGLDKAQQEARHANFRAQNGADMILRGGNSATRAALLERQRQANHDVDLAKAGALRTSESRATNRDFVGEEGRVAAIAAGADANARAAVAAPLANAQTAATTGNTLANTRHQDLAAQIQELAIKGTKDQQSMVAKIRAETDPAKQRQLVTTLLASQGKEKPDSYKLAHMKGGSDPNNPLATMPDQAYLVNEATGTVQRIGNDQQPAVAAGAAGTNRPKSYDEFAANWRAANKGAKDDPLLSDDYLKKLYAAKFGQGK